MFKLVFLLFGKPKTQVLYNMNMHNAALIKKKKLGILKNHYYYMCTYCVMYVHSHVRAI